MNRNHRSSASEYDRCVASDRPHAYELAVSSTKSVTGHCFGAAGAIESMMCVRALHHGVLLEIEAVAAC